MSTRIAALSLSLAAVAPALAAASGAPGLADERAAEAAALVATFRNALMAALSQGLQDGAAAAVGVCSDEAPALASAAARPGVRLGRTSHRLRNPENLPPDWAGPLLEACAAGEPCTSTLVQIDAERTGWVEPIFTQPMCLACHGSALASDVQAVLDQRYPEDQATGFAAGEFRGLFWAEVAGTPPVPRHEDALDLLMRLQTGSFTSAAQARRDERYDEVIWHIAEIWAGETAGERWIYTEGWLPDADGPYMQRVARYSQRQDGSIVAARYQLPDPTRFVGGWQAPERFAALDADSLIGLPGCETVMARTGPRRFEGGTVGMGCANTHRGASYAVSQTVLDEEGLLNWDRGFARDGSLRWGPAAGGYRFRRVDEAGTCVDPVRLLVYGNVQQRERFVAYARALAESGLYPAYGGHYEATTPALAVLEGDPPPGRGVIIARFPCLEAVQAFWNSPEYEEIRKLREGIAEFEVLVLPALPTVAE